MAYHINEELGDIYYEVIGDQLILKIRDGILGRGCDIYIIKSDDTTVPSDDTVFSSKRTLEEIAKRAGEGGGYWEMKEDSSGNKYIYTQYPMVSQYGATFYAGAPIGVGSIYEGLPIDNDTIYWQEYDNGVKILKAKGGGEGSTFNSAEMWRLLGAPSAEQINSTHISTALQPYATTNSVNQAISEVTRNFVTINTEQEISAAKHFLQGLSVGANKHKLYEKDGVVYLDGDLAVTGGITQYALGDTPVSTIMDGVAVDGTTISKEGGVLKVIGGGGSSFDDAQMWKLLGASSAEQINKSHLTTALQGYATTADVDDRIDDLINGAPAAFDTLKEIADVLQGNVDSIGDIFEVLETKWTQDDAKIANWDSAYSWGNHASAGYAHLAEEETFTGLKHFTAGLSVGAGKHKLYEKDGVVYFDGDLAVTGGITQYATDGVSVSTIMDGVTADEVTITKGSDNVLRIKNAGSGSSFDKAAMWAALAANTTDPIHKSHLTTALQGYATESWANSNFPTKLGNGASGTWGIDISGTANYASRLNPAYGIIGSLDTLGDNTICSWNSGTNSKPSPYGTIFQFSNVKKPLPGTSEHWINQIAYGTNERIYVRQRINNGSWTIWRTLAYISDTIPQAENSNKLQNLTWSDFFSRKYHYIDYGAQSTSNFYPIFFFPSDIELDCEIHSDNVSAADAYNQNRIHFQLTAQGWSDAGLSFRILSRNNYNDTEITIGAIGCGDKDGGIAIWVRGGKRYRLYCNKTPYMKTSDFIYGSNGEKYTVGTNLDGGTNSFVNIIWKNDVNRNDGLVATVDGNVYSATKLQNTRTIWGQNFNGERNVNGDLREVNNIYTNRGTIDARVFGYNPSDNHDGMPWYGFRHNDNNHIAISGNGGIDFYTAAGNTLSLSSNGRTYADSLEAKNDIIISGAGVFTTSNNAILRKRGNTHTDVLGWYWNETYGDHLTFNIPGTNDQSKWMKLSATLGLVISGGAKIGNYILYQNESTLSIYSDYNQNFTSEYGKETTCLQTSFDGQDPETSSYPSQHPSRCVLALQPRGGWVGIGLRNPTTTLDVNGNILSRGGITQYSDQRAKTIIEQINLSLKNIANSPAIRFKWNGWKQKDDGKTHIGGIAQYVQNVLPEAIYNSDDVLTMDYATTGYIFAVQTAKHLLSYETKTDKEIKQLKKRVKYLEKQLKKLGYEEIGTLDN